MSLQRLMLRAAFVQALRNGNAPPWPTIAQGRVFDSRLGPIPETKKDSLIPVIAVYTDLDERTQIEKGSQAGRFERVIDVVLVLSIGTWGEVQVAEGETAPVWGPPQIDSELEAMLDLFEVQVWRAIYDHRSPHANVLHDIVMEITEWQSICGREPNGNIKISERQLVLKCRVADDCRPAAGPNMGPPPGEGEPIFPKLAARAPYLTGLLSEIEARADPWFVSLQRTIAELTGAAPPDPAPELEEFRVTYSQAGAETDAVYETPED